MGNVDPPMIIERHENNFGRLNTRKNAFNFFRSYKLLTFNFKNEISISFRFNVRSTSARSNMTLSLYFLVFSSRSLNDFFRLFCFECTRIYFLCETSSPAHFAKFFFSFQMEFFMLCCTVVGTRSSFTSHSYIACSNQNAKQNVDGEKPQSFSLSFAGKIHFIK